MEDQDDLEDRISTLLFTHFDVDGAREAAREIMKLVEAEREEDYRSTVLDMEASQACDSD